MRSPALTASIGWRQNRWLILGLAATVALALLVVLGFSGLIGGGDTRRDAVAAYIEQVNATQRGLAIERERVSKVYVRARKDPRGLAADIPALDRSTATLRRFDRRLRALRPPPDAVVLHNRLIALSAAEARLAAEIANLGRFLPIVTAERRAVGIAGARLQRGLGGTATPAEQAAAFRQFAAAVDQAARPLPAAPVPAALEPVVAEELARTAELARSARAVATALDRGGTTNVQTLVRRFSVAAAGKGNAVERAAVIAFDEQGKRIGALRLAVAEELSRLDREDS